MKGIFAIFLLTPLTALAQLDTEALDLIKVQTNVNDIILHDNSQNEIENNYLSKPSLYLLSENSKLKLAVNEEIESQKSNNTCALNDENEDPKKKKKVNSEKSKSVEDKGWVIIGSVEVHNQNTNQTYEQLQPPLTQAEYNQFYTELTTANTIEELKETILRQTANMDTDAYLSYLSQMTSRLPYNDPKAKFVQNEQRVDSLFSMLQEDKNARDVTIDANAWGGICGDIHFATVLMGETARPNDFEYFTASYVVSGSQHVYAFAVDKKDPNKIVVINYSRVQVTNSNNGIESAMIKHDQESGSFNNIGGDIRIFKHTGSGIENEGTAKHVATVPTAIGSFLQNVALDDRKKTLMPGYNQFVSQEVKFEHQKTKTKTKETEYDDGSKEVSTQSKDIAQGVKFIHGTINNLGVGPTDIFSIAVYRDKKKNLNQYGQVIDSKKTATESNINISANSISQEQMNVTDQMIYLRINYNTGIHRTLVETDKVNIQADANMNINADYMMMNNEKTGDGNLRTNLGVDAQYHPTKIDHLAAGVTLENQIGLKEERSIYNMSELPKNIQMTPNVLQARVNYTRELNQKVNATIGSTYTGTQIGSVFEAHTGFSVQNNNQGARHEVLVTYMLPGKGINRNISSYLLPEQENIQLNYNLQKGRVNAGAYFQLQTTNMTPFFGGSLKIDLSSKKKKKK